MSSGTLLALLTPLTATAETRDAAAANSARGSAPSAAQDLPASGPLPRLRVPEAIYDFGTVKQGVPVEHRFKLENVGKGPLKILKMHTSCGCTAAVLDSDTIAPAGETFVKATFDTTGFQGTKLKTVRLYTNDPKQASFVLSLQGTVRPDVQVSNQRVRFGSVPRGSTPTAQISVTTDVASPIKILEASSRSPALQVQTEDISSGGAQGKRITVRLAANAPLGVFRDRVTVKTSSAENPVINIPVTANIEGDLLLEPSVLSLGLLTGPLTAPITRDIALRSRSGRPLKITSVESDNRNVSGNVLRDGEKYIIRVTIGGDIQGALRARLVISTDNTDAEQRQVILPVFGIISRAS